MKLTKLFEDLSNRLQGTADDHEVEMAITDLRAIADMAGKLAEHLSQENPAELEGWVQGKITKAADYIESVYKNHVYGEHDCGCGSAARGLSEAASTCCGKCGHKHVKGTSCPKPYLTGARHCRNRD
jgi:hypothetical protein